MSCDEIYWAFMISLMPRKCQWKGCPLLPGKGKINWMSSTGHQTGRPALATKLDIKLDVQYWPPNWTSNWTSSTGHQTGQGKGHPRVGVPFLDQFDDQQGIPFLDQFGVQYWTSSLMSVRAVGDILYIFVIHKLIKKIWSFILSGVSQVSQKLILAQ